MKDGLNIAYKSQNQNTAVPQRYREDPQQNVGKRPTQTIQDGNDIRTTCKLLKLIDFVCVVKKNAFQWIIMYKRHIAYKKKYTKHTSQHLVLNCIKKNYK